MQATQIEIYYESMSLLHYNDMMELWKSTDGVGMGKGDSKEEMAMFLNRNEGLSFIAKSGDQLIGTILCGHDGRRGYIYHVAVDKIFRFKGIARKLVEMSMEGLKKSGIGKCHLFVFKTNTEAQAFWSQTDWNERVDLVIMSKSID